MKQTNKLGRRSFKLGGNDGNDVGRTEGKKKMSPGGDREVEKGGGCN